MTESHQRTAAAEIKAWTVGGTPSSEVKAGLLDAYRTRCSCEKDAFVTALIDLIAERALPCPGNGNGIMED
jgi:hypothetical protein